MNHHEILFLSDRVRGAFRPEACEIYYGRSSLKDSLSGPQGAQRRASGFRGEHKSRKRMVEDWRKPPAW